jgi:hypothetical protein
MQGPPTSLSATPAMTPSTSQQSAAEATGDEAVTPALEKTEAEAMLGGGRPSKRSRRV